MVLDLLGSMKGPLLEMPIQSLLRGQVVHSWSTLPVLWSFLVLVDVLAKGVHWVPWVLSLSGASASSNIPQANLLRASFWL